MESGGCLVIGKLILRKAIDEDALMEQAGLDPKMSFKNFGLQSDGTLVVFDRCDSFEYLDAGIYEVKTLTV